MCVDTCHVGRVRCSVLKAGHEVRVFFVYLCHAGRIISRLCVYLGHVGRALRR